MTTRIKSTLLLSLTLVIGMVLGAVINAYVAKRRFEHVGYLRSERGFTKHIEDAIEPRDEAQRNAVHAILERSATRMCEHMQVSAAEGKQIMDSTRAELARVLTPEQLQLFDKVARPPARGPRGHGREKPCDRPRERMPSH